VTRVDEPLAFLHFPLLAPGLFRLPFRRPGFSILALLCLAHGGFAGEIDYPKPPPRPFDLAPPFEAPLPPARPENIGAPLAPEAKDREPTAGTDVACARILASGHVVATIAAPVIGPDGCGIAAPLKLEAVVLVDGRHVSLEPHALVRCDLAAAMGDWVREDIAPPAEKAGGGLATILGSVGYECRGRNGVAGATLSEHGKGNAFDLRGVVLLDGKTLVVEGRTEAREFMEQVRNGACARFTTVLGPGSDAYHEAHVHVDLESRRGGYRICQWDIR
jgi:hypothetical protein